jgi:hypothetical protein
MIEWEMERGRVPEDHRGVVGVPKDRSPDERSKGGTRTQSFLQPDELKSEWFYKDETTHAVCGPYLASEIVEWRRSNALTKDVMVLKAGETRYQSFLTRAGEMYTQVRQEHLR